LKGLECPNEHQLVYELCKVPQIDERLECMLFHVMFQESLCAYRASLTTLHKVLEMLHAKREIIQRFFMTALRLGQSLNRDSNAPKAPNGFSLASLEKLSQTKSTKLPRLSILHFILALMGREDVQALFDVEDIALLLEARALKTHKVFADCVELAQGLYGVQQICDTGKYVRPETGQAVTIERRRRSVTPQSAEAAAEAAIDTDDHFHEIMKEFVDANIEAAEDLGEGAFKLILLYKELAIYFDDMRNVYPPPKSENESRKDLVDVFGKFAIEVQRHREEVESEGLREMLQLSGGQGKGSAEFDSFRGASLPGMASRPRCSTFTAVSSPAHGASTPDASPASKRPEDGDTSFMPYGGQGRQSLGLAVTPNKADSAEAFGFRSNLVDCFVREEMDILERSMIDEAPEPS